MSELAKQIAGLSPEQRAALIKRIAKKQAEDRRRITRRTDPDSYPLSFIQERLWMLNQFEPGPLYNDYTAFRLTGSLNVMALERALGEIVRRHEALRAIYPNVDGRPLQVITPASAQMKLPFVDLHGATEQEVMRRAREEAQLPFDLSRGPLMRATLLRTGDNEHMLLMTMHHIITDGWSMGVLLNELSKLYEAYVTGQESPLAELPIQYADYAAWQREYLKGEVLEKQLTYWREQLRGATTLLNLPTDRPRPSIQTFNGTRYYFELPRDLTHSLRALSQQEGATLFMTLLAAFNILLQRYTGQTDISLGTPVAGRNQAEVEKLIGVFINTLVLRTQLSGDPPFRELLGRVRTMTINAFANQELPFERLVEALQPERNLSHTPIFQVMFSFQVPSGGENNEFAGLRLNSLDADNQMSPFDLVVQLTEGMETVHGRFQYNTDLFEPATIERMTMHFRVLLQSIVANPEQRISELPLLTPSEERQAIQEFNQHYTAYPTQGCLHEFFEQQVERTPEAIALVHESESLTYAELNARANQLAHLLRSRGARAESLVGVLMERSVEMVVALLAVLKAGAGYVPLDPSYPAERLSMMLDDSGLKLLLTHGRLEAAVAGASATAVAGANVEVISLEAVSDELSRQSRENVGRVAEAQNVAYVIYTSGSTGRPKGVVVTHGNVERLFAATGRWYNFESGDVWTLFHSIAFDFSVWELWGALLYGGRLVIVPYEVSREPEEFYQLLEREGVTVLNQTPSAFRQLMEVDERRWEVEKGAERGGEGLRLRTVIMGGEALELGSLRGWMERHGEAEPEIVNMYGITETTVHVSYRRIEQKDVEERASSSLIGQPIGDLRVYILDERMQPVPVGVRGEIYVAGGGVARGYLYHPELTAERFVPDSFSSEAGARLYRTGDVGRWLRQGEIEYLGRIDYQVKIRGFRIELGEIEATLAEHPAVNEAVVVTREYGPDDKRLVAYIAPNRQRALAVRQMLRLEREGRVLDAPRYELPNGMVIFHQNKSETDFVYDEIFRDQVYLKHGVTLQDGDCIFDVGANIGLFTLFAGQRCKNAVILAFEPIPPVFESLRLNGELYGLNVIPFQCGLSDEEREDTFVFYPHVSVISGRYTETNEAREVVKAFLLNQQEAGGTDTVLSEQMVNDLLEERLKAERYTCPVRPLSDVIREYNVERLDLLKIDVEKGELDVLSGIAESDWSKIRQLVVEVHDIDGRLELVANLLSKHGYILTIEQEKLLQHTGLYNVYARQETNGWPERLKTTAATDGEAEQVWASTRALTADAQRFLKERLPDYMVPSAFVLLESIPLTTNGKIDRRALPEPSEESVQGKQAYEAAKSPTQERLCEIWTEVLGVPNVGINDDFFNLGGHSLLATQIISRTRNAFEIDLPVRSIFQHPTVAGLSELVEKAVLDQVEADLATKRNELVGKRLRGKTDASATSPAIRRRPVAGPAPLSLSQERIWFLDRLEPGSAVHNAPSALRLEGHLDDEALEKALSEIVRRHEALRTRFEIIDGQPMAITEVARPVKVTVVNLSHIPDEQRDEEIVRLAGEEARREFDLSTSPLVRATLLRWAPTSQVLLLTLHHIVFDGWSKGVLIRELLTLYEAFSASRPSPLKELPIQYADFAVWQRTWLQGEVLEGQLAYWRQRLKEAPTLELPTDRPRPEVQTFRGSRQWISISSDLSDSLRELARVEGTSLFMVLLATFKVQLNRYTKQTDLVVGTHVANRTRAETESLIGFFVNTLALRTDLSGDPTFRELLAQVRDVTLGAYQHQEVPFEKVVEALSIKADKSRRPLFQVMFALHNAPRPPIKVAGLTQSMVKFDDRLVRYDLEFDLWRGEDGLEGFLVHNADLIDDATTERMVEHYIRLLQAIVATSGVRLSELPSFAMPLTTR